MIVWDVQHGNAVYYKTPNGKHMVIDLGTGDSSGHNIAFSPLGRLWHHYGIRQLDHVTITHPHRDHIDDILNLDAFNPRCICTLGEYSENEIMAGVRDSDRPKFEKYCEIKRRYYVDARGTYADTSIAANYGGVIIKQFLTSDLPKDNMNNHSVFTVIEFCGIKVVLPGDNECPSLTKLMEREDFKSAVKNAYVLLAPHHGRESAFHSDFVSVVNPHLTIISDGSICDTSANHRYSAISRGWKVWKGNNGGSEVRRLLTTNHDGEIYMNFGNNGTGDFLAVTVAESVAAVRQ
jgi:competence protein ComEC